MPLPLAQGAQPARPHRRWRPTSPGGTGFDTAAVTSFNLIDVALVLVVLLAAWRGWAKGFVVAAMQLVTLLLALAVAFLGWRFLAGWLTAQLPAWEVWWPPISFVALYLLADLAIGAITLRLALAFPQRAHEHGFNRLLGLAPGLANGLLHATVLTVLLLTVPAFDQLTRLARDSALAERLAAPAEWLESQLAPVFDPAIRRTLQGLTVPPESRTSVALPVRLAEAPPRPDLEARMLQMVNTERRTHGLPALQADPELTAVARAHSRDMFARGYFSHYTPEGGDLGDRLRAGRVRFLAAGENLAYAPTLAIAHQGLMESPGHRANILRPQFGRLGIGVLDGGRHGLMVTQNFRN